MGLHSETDRDTRAVKDEANQMWRDAKDAARSAADSQQRAAASGVGEFADALRQAAHNVGDGQATAARVAQSVADGLDRLSGTLRNRDFRSMVHDVEDFARAQPLVFFGAAMATGFVAMRFLKSSEPTTGTRSESTTGMRSEPTTGMRSEQPGQWPVTDPVTPYDSSAAPGNRPITSP